MQAKVFKRKLEKLERNKRVEINEIIRLFLFISYIIFLSTLSKLWKDKFNLHLIFKQIYGNFRQLTLLLANIFMS